MHSDPAHYPWIPDLGNGSYRNPVLHADYSDPDVIRHGDDFYLIASSFNCTPGLPVLHSLDLVNWRLINHAIRNVPHPSYSAVRPGCGVWAPSLRFHAGKFWIFFPMPDEGIYVTTATDPAGEWSEPHLLQAAKGWIDPCPFWDDDGQAYLVHAYAKSRSGLRDKLHVRPMAPDASRLLGEGQIIVDAPHHPFLEGPKVHKLNGWYYILAPGGGVPQGWQVVYRSRNIYGPFEEKVVLEKGSTPINGPHQGALVDLSNDEWWFLHFQDTGPFGRIVHLQPVQWKEGWPLMGVDYDGNGVGEPVPEWRKPTVAGSAPCAAPATDDLFDAPTLGLQWQWQANHEPSWASLTARPGWLRLFGRPMADGNLCLTPHLLMQKFPARTFAVETQLQFNPAHPDQAAGLVILGGGESAALLIEGHAGQRALVLRINGELHFTAPTPESELCLHVAVDAEANCTFAFSRENEKPTRIAKTFTAKEGGWIGAKVGLVCLSSNPEATGSFADFASFKFAPFSSPSTSC